MRLGARRGHARHVRSGDGFASADRQGKDVPAAARRSQAGILVQQRWALIRQIPLVWPLADSIVKEPVSIRRYGIPHTVCDQSKVTVLVDSRADHVRAPRSALKITLCTAHDVRLDSAAWSTDIVFVSAVDWPFGGY